ncbi:MAG: ribosome silencing factor [Bacilli bacterium]|nr:ribosome silencing factor [Bacilli bacterium]
MAYPKLIKETKELLEDKKGEDIKIIDVRQRTPFTDYYILATAPNMRAIGAYADALEDFFQERVEDLRQSEGQPESGWVLVDAGEVVVHLFSAAKRQEMNLEDLFK